MQALAHINNLTAVDRALHELELETLRTHLFRDHTPQSLYIIGEPEVIPPSVIVCWYPEPPRRTLLKGGFRYQVYLPGAHGPSQFSIQHLAEGRYWLSTSYVDYRGAIFTRSSLTLSLADLPGAFKKCVQDMEREHAMSRSTKR